ncbi:MAG: hypothetical protein ACW98I_17510 [Candidatus Hodarchaeales archaeon]|jgi:hypothetical protein
MSPLLRRPKKKLQNNLIPDLPSPPSLEDKEYSQSVYYPILSPPPTVPEDILNRPPSFVESASDPEDNESMKYVKDDLTSDILKEITEGGFSSLLKGVPPKKPIVLHVEDLAIKQFKAAKDAYLSAGEKHLVLKFYENAGCLYSCAVLCVFLSEDIFQAAHLMKELGTQLPLNVIKSHIFQGAKLLLKANLLRNISYLKQAEKWMFQDRSHMYKEDQELIERAIRESKLAIEKHAFDA